MSSDELFEQRLRRNLRRLAEELVEGPGQDGRGVAGDRRWYQLPRPSRRGLRRILPGWSPRASRALVALWVLSAALLLGGGIVAGLALAGPGAPYRTVRPGPEQAALDALPSPLAVVSGDQLLTLSPGGPEKTMAHATIGSAPQWSADGAWVAYLGPGGRLHAVAADGGRELVLLPWPVTAFTWSPAADLLAAIPAAGPDADHLVVTGPPRAEGSAGSPTVVGPLASSFVWSADGHDLAYTVPGAGSVPDRVVVVDLISGARRTLPYRPPAGTGVQLAGFWPNGQGLLAWLDPGRSAAAEATGLTLVALRLGSSVALPLATTFVYLPWLAWSPGGRRLALVAQVGALPWLGSQVEICRPALGRCHALPQPPGTVTLDPAWSPAGNELAVVRAPELPTSGPGASLDSWDLRRRLWVVPADGGQGRLVRGSAPGATAPRFGLTGTTLVYATAQGVQSIPVQGGRSVGLLSGLRGALDTAGPDGFGKLPWGGVPAWQPS